MMKALYRLERRVCRNVLGIAVGLLMFSLSSVASAQNARPPVIDAGNIERLQSVSRIDFDSQATDYGVTYRNGRFALRADGQRVALADVQGEIYILDEAGLVDGVYSVRGEDGMQAGWLEMAFGPDNSIASIHTDGDHFFVAAFDYETDALQVTKLSETLLDVWWGDSSLLLETQTAISTLTDNRLMTASHAFKQDTESVIRIGRIAPPLAVTVTEDGRVRRWNMETGEVTAEVRVEDALPIYGQVNAGGDRYLAWRDPMSEALHLLDFETGEDRIIAELNGTYIPFIFLTANADVIIGVYVDDEPVVVAWDVATGEKHVLGEYRSCNRALDMARLSRDGTTLVIGCDTGLDIWRVSDS